MIITILKAQQTVPTHKKSVWSCLLLTNTIVKKICLIFLSSVQACMYGILYKLWFVVHVILVTLRVYYVKGKRMSDTFV